MPSQAWTRRQFCKTSVAGALALHAPSAVLAAAEEPVRVRWLAHLLTHRLRPSPASETSLWGINGKYPPPLLRLRHGQEFSLELTNNTPLPLAFYAHGVRSSGGRPEGVWPTPLPPAATGTTLFRPRDSGFFLYRPLVMNGSCEPTARGLGGALIVEEAQPPLVDAEHVILVQDWLLDEQQQLSTFERASTSSSLFSGGRLGNMLSINGKSVPERLRFAPGSRVRVRLGNLCVSRMMRLRFDDLKVYVIAIDGQPTDTFEPLRSTLPFAPGSRYDLIIDLPLEDKKVGFITATIANGTALVALETAGASLEASSGVKRLSASPLSPLPPNTSLSAGIRLQDALRAEMVLEGGARITSDGRVDSASVMKDQPWRMNGTKGDIASKPLFTARKGQPVVLTLANKTDFAQPIHIHGHVFRLLHPFDDGWEPYWLDTLHMPEQRTLRVAFIAEQPGKWLISNTNLERLDAGMWSWFEVI
jgi:FtsP/CotA-like multicopper oxidase with cupredoxin domain